MHIVRVTGGLQETLVAAGVARATVRGQPFEVPDDIGRQLLEDKTGRFQPAQAPAQPAAPLDVDAEDTESA